MAKIIQKLRTTDETKPTTAQLDLGEIAINAFSGKLFIKKDDGSESIVEIISGEREIFPFTAVQDQEIFSPIVYKEENNVDVYLNGILLGQTDYVLGDNAGTKYIEVYETLQKNDKIIVKAWVQEIKCNIH